MLEARNLCWGAGKKTIVNDVSLKVGRGEFLGIVGPNGCGKTSIMSLLAGLRRPSKGSVFLDDKPISQMSRRKIACQIAFVEQHADTGDHINARQAVELGRTPHLSALSPWSEKDTIITNDALKKVNMTSFSERQWNTLSGGEKQRLHFARALAQEPSVMLLDEPTNHLDIHHQLSLLALVREQNLTVIAALHDLNHAAMFCDRIAVIDQGELVAQGLPTEILTSKLISDVFRVDAMIAQEDDGTLYIRYKNSINQKNQTREIL